MLSPVRFNNISSTLGAFSLMFLVTLLTGCGEAIETASIPSTPTGMAYLTWVPPTRNIDDTLLTDLAGFRIYLGTASGQYTNSITVSNSSATAYTVFSLPTNTTVYFAVTAFNTIGYQSAFSVETNKYVTELAEPTP